MKAWNGSLIPLALAVLAVPAAAQEEGDKLALNDTARARPAATAEQGEAERASTLPPIVIDRLRPYDKRGVNVFESPKQSDQPFEGFRIGLGAAFTQQFQSLGHENTAEALPGKDSKGGDVDLNQLADIGWGFNLATANLALNAQLAPGIRVSLESYMSSRHHNEFWVKGGYLQMDESPIDHPVLNRVMDFVTIKAGMFELNYGDAHFRRTDNGNAMHNPFVENYLLDSFNTEIGAEVYFRTGPWLAMAGVTDGVNKGGVLNPESRGPAFLGKLGYDQQVSEDLRVRLTGSVYKVDKTPSNNLYGGDRAGSRYYSVMDNTVVTPANAFTSGRLNPGFRNELTAVQVNPFVKLGGLELFGVVERAEGRAASEAETRVWNHYAADAIYRFGRDESLYLGGRWNTAGGDLPFRSPAGETGTYDVSADRMALAGGWFITPTILVKGEYVKQSYNDFPVFDIRNGGKFDGFVIEGVVAF